jgi:hypothetical protein
VVESQLSLFGLIFVVFTQFGAILIVIRTKGWDQVMLNLLSGDEGIHEERIFSKLWLFLFFNRHAHSFEHCGLVHHVTIILLLNLASSFDLIGLLLWEVARLSVTMELPDIDTVLACSRNYLIVVTGVKHNICDRVCMSNKSLEIVWYGLLCLIVPNLD